VLEVAPQANEIPRAAWQPLACRRGRAGRTWTQHPHLAPMGQWGVAAAMLPLS